MGHMRKQRYSVRPDERKTWPSARYACLEKERVQSRRIEADWGVE